MFHILLHLHYVVTEESNSPGWKCPNISSSSSSSLISCGCDIPHTLRCDGIVKKDQQIVLNNLTTKVKYLSANEGITLLDISIQNLTRLPGKIFKNMSIEGLVISTGRLEYVHDKAFLGLEYQLTALGLPANKLTSIPTQSLNILKMLTRFDMSNNLVTSIHSLPSLPDLEYLDMSRNKITTLAAGVTQSLPHLKTLLLAENMMKSSSLSNDNLQHLSSLHPLNITQKKITGYLAPSTIEISSHHQDS